MDKFSAVEYGEHFSELCREKFKDYPNFSVITDKFENIDFANEAYNLVFSAKEYITLLGTYSDHIAI